jgi:NADPH:quinone reductase-like Zn-dependent oxidoreductase
MKAIVQRGYGAPDEVLTFRDVDPPRPRDRQVLVRSEAASVDIGDWLMLEGLPYFARPGYGIRGPKHPIPGQTLAGTVEAVGPDATRVRTGDEVFGWCRGGFADLAVADEAWLAPRPASVSPIAAAATPTSGLAALQALRDAGSVGAGTSVAIVGASGGVGTFAVQIARSLGAEVTGVCSTDAVELVRSLGAAHVIDYRKERLTAPGRRFEVIVDLAGNRPLADLRNALTASGTLVIVGGSGGRWFMGFGRTVGAMMRSPFTRQQLRAFFSKRRADDLSTLAEMLAAGDLQPVIERTYPLSAAADALRSVGARRARGKTVIDLTA